MLLRAIPIAGRVDHLVPGGLLVGVLFGFQKTMFGSALVGMASKTHLSG